MAAPFLSKRGYLMRRRQKGLQFYRKKKKISTAAVREFFSWVVLVMLAVFLAYMTIWSVGLRTNVIGVSMEPGLTNGQGILVNRLVYRFFSPKTGDVVVFLPNGNENAHYYVKRVVAEPGQTVQILSLIHISRNSSRVWKQSF